MLGTLRHATFDFCQYSSRYDRFLAGEHVNAFDPALSNAAVMDVGVYAAAVMVYLFGAPLPGGISATSTFLHNGMEGSGCILCKISDYGGRVALRQDVSVGKPPARFTGKRERSRFILPPSRNIWCCICGVRKEQPNPASFGVPCAKDKCNEYKYCCWGRGVCVKQHRIRHKNDTMLPHNMVHEVRAFCDLIHSQRERQSYYWSLTQQTLHVLDVARHQTGVSFAMD